MMKDLTTIIKLLSQIQTEDDQTEFCQTMSNDMSECKNCLLLSIKKEILKEKNKYIDCNDRTIILEKLKLKLRKQVLEKLLK